MTLIQAYLLTGVVLNLVFWASSFTMSRYRKSVHPSLFWMLLALFDTAFILCFWPVKCWMQNRYCLQTFFQALDDLTND